MKKVFLAVIATYALSVSGLAQQRVVTYVNGKSTYLPLVLNPNYRNSVKRLWSSCITINT